VTKVVLKCNLSDCKSLAILLWAKQSAAIGNMAMLRKGLKTAECLVSTDNSGNIINASTEQCSLFQITVVKSWHFD
jgi:hypothetical protein